MAERVGVRPVVRARTRGLVRKDVGDEIVLFDIRTDEVHLLNPSLSVVWRACGGDGASPADVALALAAALGATPDGIDDLVAAAMADLERAGLLEPDAGAGLFASPISRRSLLKKAGIAAVALPAITTILAPPVSAAISSVTCLGDHQPCFTVPLALACCGTLTCQSTTTGQKCCNTALGGTCGGFAVCCEGTCQAGNCCRPIGAGSSCTPGQHLQCCGSAVCSTVGACVACTIAGTTAPSDPTMCCSGQAKGGTCCDPAVGASCTTNNGCCGTNICPPGAKNNDPKFCAVCIPTGSFPPDKDETYCCTGRKSGNGSNTVCAP